MSVCNKNHDPFQVLHGKPCTNEAEPGRKLCAYHAKISSAQSRRQYERQKREKATRPAWMDDPSLLPKRPPGAA